MRPYVSGLQCESMSKIIQASQNQCPISSIVLRRKIIADVSVPSFLVPASGSLHEPLTPTTYTMFKGDKCNLSIFGLHTNPYVWGEDVFEFKPERFLERDGTKKGLRMREIEKGAFMPFGSVEGLFLICEDLTNPDVFTLNVQSVKSSLYRSRFRYEYKFSSSPQSCSSTSTKPCPPFSRNDCFPRNDSSSLSYLTSCLSRTSCRLSTGRISARQDGEDRGK